MKALIAQGTTVEYVFSFESAAMILLQDEVNELLMKDRCLQGPLS